MLGCIEQMEIFLEPPDVGKARLIEGKGPIRFGKAADYR